MSTWARLAAAITCGWALSLSWASAGGSSAPAAPARLPRLPLAASSPASASARLRVRIDIAQPGLLGDSLTADGFDVLGKHTAGGKLELALTRAELRELSDQGLAPQVIEVAHPLMESHAVVQQLPPLFATENDASQAAGGPPVGYPTLSAIEAHLAAAALGRPDIAQLVDLTATYGTPTTFEGRHLMALKISDNVLLDEDEPSSLLIAAHHSREVVTPLIALGVLDELVVGYGVNPALTALVDENELWIVPVFNPDGYEHVFLVDNLWRKNRRELPGGIGVDLNRNYPAGWDASCGGSTSVSSPTYRGPSPASEPEVQTLIALSEDVRFARVLDLHSFGQEVRHGYGCWNHPLATFLAAEATAVSLDSGYGGSIGSSCCLGGEIHLQTVSRSALSLLMETADAFQPSFLQGSVEVAQVLPAALAFLGRELPVSGRVSSACNGAPLVASVSVGGVSYRNGEQQGSGGPFGRYELFLPDGNYDLTFSAPGHEDKVFAVSASAGSPVSLDVALELTQPAACWTDLGGATPGLDGPPSLVAGGPLTPGSELSIGLTHAPPFAAMLFRASLSSTPVNVVGGTLFANPFALQLLLNADANGDFNVSSTVAPGSPSGQAIYFQFIVQDLSVPHQITLSNAVTAMIP